jgi:hypothetical protein
VLSLLRLPGGSAVASAIVCITAAVGSAQRTWIVDVAGGTGSHFRDIQPAINAATSGDLVFVRPSFAPYYTGFIASKGLTIMCEQRGAAFAVRGGDMVVRGLPRGERFTLKRAVGLGTCSIILEDNQGTVYLEKCQPDLGGRGNLVIRRSASVLLNEVVSIWTRIESSYVSFNRSLADSGDGADPILWVAGSVVALGNTKVLGGRGGYDMVRCLVTSPPGDAVAGYDSVLILGRGTTITGGRLSASGGSCPPVFMEADGIRGSNIRVIKDPYSAVSRVSGTVTFQTETLAALDGIVRDEVAGLMDLDLIGPPGSATALIASPPFNPVITQFGPQWVDLSNYIVADVGLIDLSTGHRKVSFYFPPLYPLGHTMVFQSVVLDQGRFHWSTPSAIVRN